MRLSHATKSGTLAVEPALFGKRRFSVTTRCRRHGRQKLEGWGMTQEEAIVLAAVITAIASILVAIITSRGQQSRRPTSAFIDSTKPPIEPDHINTTGSGLVSGLVWIAADTTSLLLFFFGFWQWKSLIVTAMIIPLFIVTYIIRPILVRYVCLHIFAVAFILWSFVAYV
jgi:hypothetical protein